MRASCAAGRFSASAAWRSSRRTGLGPGFTRARLAGVRGAGVEIVLEVEDVEIALEAFERAGRDVVEPLLARPWGLRDFRVVDPDGYYLRITAG